MLVIWWIILSLNLLGYGATLYQACDEAFEGLTLITVIAHGIGLLSKIFLLYYSYQYIIGLS